MMKINDLKLGTKLTGGFCIVACVSLIVGGVGYVGISKLAQSTVETRFSDDLVQELLQREVDHLKWNQKVGEFQRNEDASELSAEKDDHRCGFGQWLYGEGRQNAALTIPAIAPLFNEIEEPHRQLHQSAVELESLLKKGKQYRPEAIRFYGTTVADRLSKVQSLLDGIRKKANEHMTEVDKRAEQSNANTKKTLILFMLIGFAGAVTFGVLLARSIVRPIQMMTRIAEQVSRGDLSEKTTYQSGDEVGSLARSFGLMGEYLRGMSVALDAVSRGNLQVQVKARSEKDELGHSLQRMVENLRKVILGIHSGAEQVATGSGQMSSASQSLSQGAVEQASSLEEISSSMSEVAAQTKTNAENASQANELAMISRKAAEAGKKQMETTVTAMGEINQSSQQIGKIMKVIDDIAFQTNLLALNAAVEAARAGKHGKGFAVVADEVRNLASRSAKAAKETEVLIENSGKMMENGLSLATKTSAAFQEIVDGAIRVADLVAKIAVASNEQATGISQISAGLGQVDQVTQQNTANAEETAAAAQTLTSQAEELRMILAQFQLDERGSNPRELPGK